MGWIGFELTVSDWHHCHAPSDHESQRTTKSEGWRLLAKIDDVAEFLTETGDDLICEISIERRIRSPYSHSYEPEAKRKKHYSLGTGVSSRLAMIRSIMP